MSDETPKRKPVSRKELTENEKIQQRALSKVKRLNHKLARIKAVTLNMEKISSRNKDVSSKQVEAWIKEIHKILNPNNPNDTK